MISLKQLTFVICLLFLTGCGFELQNTGDLKQTINIIHIQTNDPYTVFYRNIKNQFRENGIRVTDNREEAAYVLVIEKDFSNDRVLSISAKNTPEEYEIVYQVQWSLFKDKTQLISNVKHLELQDYSFDQNQLLGKSKEAEFIMDSLATRISRAVLARLGTI